MLKVAPPELEIGWMDFKKTQQFNSGGVVKWAYFQKKVEYPFKYQIKA